MRPTLLRMNQRSTIRRAVRVECQVVRERDFKLVGKSAIDLSTRGMLVETNARVLTGEPLVVAFRSPRNGRTWFDCEATVARVVHGRRPLDRGRSIGLAFHSMGDAMKRKLFEQLRGLMPPSPTRPVRFGPAFAS